MISGSQGGGIDSYDVRDSMMSHKFWLSEWVRVSHLCMCDSRGLVKDSLSRLVARS